MKWNDFYQSVRNHTLGSVYLFSGPEEWTKREALSILRNSLLPPGLEQLNDTTLENVTARQIIDAAEVMPVMCDKRIVVVRDWGPLSEGKSKNEASEMETILEWLNHPPESCVTVFYMRSMLDNRKAAVTKIKKLAICVDFDYLSDPELSRWIKKRLESVQKTIELQALNTLLFMTGREITSIAGELEKLTAYIENRKQITLADVQRVVHPTLESSVFELMTHLLNRNLGQAQTILNHLLLSGENYSRIHSVLTHQLRQHVHMRHTLDKGGSSQQIQTLLKLHPFAARQTERQCKKRTAKEFQALYEFSVAAEFDFKQGKLRDSSALELTILKISK